MEKQSSKTVLSNETLLVALACGSTVEAAAAKAGLHKRTVYRRLDDPDFRQQLQEFRLNMLERTCAMLTASSMEAVKTLLSLMERSVPHVTRLGAARSVLELGVKMRDLVEVEQRLAVLEQSVLADAKAKKLRR
jgi:hypothetical protein